MRKLIFEISYNVLADGRYDKFLPSLITTIPDTWELRAGILRVVPGYLRDIGRPQALALVTVTATESRAHIDFRDASELPEPRPFKEVRDYVSRCITYVQQEACLRYELRCGQGRNGEKAAQCNLIIEDPVIQVEVEWDIRYGTLYLPIANFCRKWGMQESEVQTAQAA